MTIHTKKIALQRNTYIKLALLHLLRRQWWVGALAMLLTAAIHYLGWGRWAIVPPILLLLYFLFWLVQFYGATVVEDSTFIFERMSYQINSQQIILQLTPKQGMAIGWGQIKTAKARKKGFVLFLSAAHLIYLPHHIFKGTHEIRFVHMLLQRKKLI